VTSPETCDDGLGFADGDGCSSSCLIEFGWYCTGFPAPCTTLCGDGKRASTEACDDGNTGDA